MGSPIVGYVSILLFLSDDALNGQKKELVRLVLRSHFGPVVDGKVMLEIAGLRNLPVEQGVFLLFRQSVFHLYDAIDLHAGASPFVHK
jgi:hypothetical protein